MNIYNILGVQPSPLGGSERMPNIFMDSKTVLGSAVKVGHAEAYTYDRGSKGKTYNIPYLQ